MRPAASWHEGRGWSLLWFGLIVASSLLTFDPKLYINGDNVDYIRLAEAVRHGTLWGSGKYPPLFAWLLALPQSVFGVALLPQKILVTLLYCASGFLLIRRTRKMFPSPWAAPIAWIAITLIPVLEFGHYVMSEIPYLFFSLIALELFDRIPGGQRRVVLGTALAAAATFYTRSVGLSLWGALLVSFLLRKDLRSRKPIHFIAVSAALILPWVLRSTLGPPNPYFRQLIQINAFHPEFGLLDAAGWAARISKNVEVYLLGEIPMALFPALFRWTYDPADLRYSFLPAYILWLPLLLLAIGLGRSLHRREPIGIYVVFYLVINLLWPQLWTGLRFLVPVLPFLALHLFEGLLFVLGLVGSRLPRMSRVASLLLILWIGLGIKNQAALARQVRAYPPDWGSYFRAAEWIRDHAPLDALIVDRKASLLAYACGRDVINFPREDDPTRMIAWMDEKGVDLVVVPSLPYDDIMRYLQPTIVANQYRFEPVFEIEDPYTVVLRLLPTPRDAVP